MTLSDACINHQSLSNINQYQPIAIPGPPSSQPALSVRRLCLQQSDALTSFFEPMFHLPLVKTWPKPHFDPQTVCSSHVVNKETPHKHYLQQCFSWATKNWISSIKHLGLRNRNNETSPGKLEGHTTISISLGQTLRGFDQSEWELTRFNQQSRGSNITIHII